MSRNVRLVVETELYKIMKRKDTWMMFAILLVPALYAIGIASGSDIITYNGNGNITAINFMSAMFQMSQSMFIFNVLLAAISSRSLGTEIEGKSILLYLNKIGDRKLLYTGKVIALSIYSIIVDVLLAVFSLIFYYFVLNGKTDIVNGALSNENSIVEIIQIIAICMFWIMTILFALAFSTKYKMVTCIGIYMITYIAMNLLSYANAIKYVSPLYYITRFTDMEWVRMTDLIIFTVYFVGVSFFMIYVGKQYLEKRDI